MTLTEKLSALISTYMSRPGHIGHKQSDSDFIMSGLRAASSANKATREKILSDVSDILNCSSEDLNFLFVDFTKTVGASKSQDISMPDYRSEIYSLAE